MKTQNNYLRSTNENNSRTRVILVRHGRSTYNEQGRYQGSSDDSILTEKGRDDAYQTGLALAGHKIDAIYTSPLKRTQQTAREILNAIISSNKIIPPLHLNDKLKEISLHHWEGQHFQDIKEQFDREYRLWKQSPDRFSIEIPQANYIRGNLAVRVRNTQYFPVLDLWEQTKQFWQEILPRHAGQTIVIVSHGGTNRALISNAIGLTPDRFHALQQCNCGISILDFPPGETRSAQLQILNYTNHLGKILPKIKEGKQGLRLVLVPTTSSSSKPDNLSQFIPQNSLDFAISNGCENSHAIAQQILKSHPKTVHLQVSREDLPQVWQQQIYSRSHPKNSDKLLTGLVVGENTVLQNLLGRAIGIDSNYLQQLNFSNGAIAVVHYPTSSPHPVLQAVIRPQID